MSPLFKHLVAILNIQHYRRLCIGGLALILCSLASDRVRSAELPSVNGLRFQTSGPNRCANIGDWYTTDGTGSTPNCNTNATSTDKIHRFNIDITQEMIDAAGGTVNITILDAESKGDLDEVGGTSDPTRFQLFDESGVLLDSKTTTSNSPDRTNLVFSISSAGTYQITSETGARFINGDNNTTLNDDDNTFSIQIPDAGTAPELQSLIGQFQGTMQQNTGNRLSFDLYFLVGPGTNALKLRNFDVDNNLTSLVYRNPRGASVGNPTISGNANWNGSGNLNTGSDDFAINTTEPNFADVGIWTIEFNGLTNNNQFILEVNTGDNDRLIVYDSPPVRAGNFTITPDTTRTTTVNTPVDHPFDVTNIFGTTDIINLSLSGTEPNYTTELINASTSQPLTDTDNDGNLDTGILDPNETISLILRVTPNTDAIGNDTTQIDAVSYMDLEVDPNNNITRSITKTTAVLDYGDAPTNGDPAPNGIGTTGYGEATHAIVSGTQLGTNIDAEVAAQNSAGADGDDNDGTDDDDGVTIPSLAQGQTATITADVAGTGGYLQGWIDWNGNGSFDAGEQVASDLQDNGTGDTDNTSGRISFDVNVPADAITTNNTFARFRWSTTQGLDSTTAATDGEVEDYQIAIATVVTVSGTVYEDFGAGGDNNNTFDNGEGTIGNVTVNLFEDNNNDNQPDGAAVQTVETDASTGAYQFSDVASGRYLIRVDTRDSDIPSTHAIGTPNPIQINISNADIIDRNFGFNTISKTCPAGSFLSEQTFLNFQNPVAEPDTTNGNYNVGAVYRFPNVTTDIDALVEITSLNNATLTEIDINNFGIPSAFQPQVLANSTNQGQYSVDFDIDFVQSGTNTPVELRRVLATGIDIDGDSGQVREASELGGNQFTTYAIDSDSRLTATELANDRVRFESTTNFNLANITVNSLNQGSVYYDKNTQSIEYRAGLIIDSGDGQGVANQRLTSLIFDCVQYNLAVTSDPNLLLVKRITAINPGQSDGVSFNSFIDDPNTPDDNAPNWPDNDNIYLPGRISVTDVKPGDEVEYTIYFLSFGGKPATNVKICDVVPDRMSFVADSYNGNSGIALLNSSASGATPTNLTNAADTDGGTFYAPGAAPPTVGNPPANLCQKVDDEGNITTVGAAENINGAIVVEIDSLPQATEPGTPANSYGFIRFRARVQ